MIRRNQVGAVVYMECHNGEVFHAIAGSFLSMELPPEFVWEQWQAHNRCLLGAGNFKLCIVFQKEHEKEYGENS